MVWVPKRLIKERREGRRGDGGGRRREGGGVEGKRKGGKKSSSLEVELVLQSLLSLCSEWKRVGGVGALAKDPRV